MDDAQAQVILDKIVLQIFGVKNPFNLEEFAQKFAFDIVNPRKVTDIHGGETWTRSTNEARFIKQDDLSKLFENNDGLQQTVPLSSVSDVIAAWQQVDVRVTERYLNAHTIAQSDGIIESENVYSSTDIRQSKNILFSDGMGDCEYLAACNRCGDSSYCIRLEDSGECANSFNISWSSKIVNCFMMHDCYDMQDSMLCTGMRGKQYCVANMQFTKQEYEKIKSFVIEWMLS